MKSKQKNVYMIVLLIILICIIAILILKKKDLEGLAVLNSLPVAGIVRRIA